jgi:hypothetical protein
MRNDGLAIRRLSDRRRWGSRKAGNSTRFCENADLFTRLFTRKHFSDL